jgi:diguanylate cyclase (GGDEF)-like protein
MACPPPPPPDDSLEKTAVLQGDLATLNKELQKAKEQDACLIIIRGNPQGHRFFLTQEEMVIGRDPAAEISLAEPSISRRHAKVIKRDGKVMLSDLGSSNGSFVNDKKVNPNDTVVLAKEDMIRLGNFILKFLPAGELEILFYGSLGSAAHTDPLTKIYNKGYLLQAIEAEFKRARALHTDLSVLFFDLDHFKKVNDTFGHAAGDYVLKEFANLVRSTYIRPKDIFARYGGEEFVILLSNTNSKNAAEIAERIRSSIEAHNFVFEGKRMAVTSSMGVSQLLPSTPDPQALLAAADKALYAAKGSGRNRVVVAN